MKLLLLEEKYGIVKLSPNEEIPRWAAAPVGGLLSITYTPDELSIVCKEEQIPGEGLEHIEKSWSCFKVEGPLDFSLTGILNMLTRPLAEQNISIFAISTYDTDYLLVKTDKTEQAIRTLADEGHEILHNL
ncbi:ACT domain-containing protein [Paenibacillus caui]|uniref:ACT domain-containing protein n=1 Tax=Paenibacillus caui TaxID=2873927 RepID=UPI001CA89FD1|nr:ACT domain-containing protein [Paenibacillus caui]